MSSGSAEQIYFGVLVAQCTLLMVRSRALTLTRTLALTLALTLILTLTLTLTLTLILTRP